MITGHHGRKSRCIASHPVTLHNHKKKPIKNWDYGKEKA